MSAAAKALKWTVTKVTPGAGRAAKATETITPELKELSEAGSKAASAAERGPVHIVTNTTSSAAATIVNPYNWGKGVAIGVGTYEGYQTLEQFKKTIASVPTLLSKPFLNAGRQLHDAEEAFMREMHALEDGAKQSLGQPVSRALQVVAVVSTIAGVTYITYKIVG